MRIIYAWVMAVVLLASCGGDKNGGQLRTPNAGQDETAENEEVAEEVEAGLSGAGAICLWKELSLRETAGADGKWITSAVMGEKMEYTGNTETLEEKGKENTYHEVKLGDGTQGWVRSEFVALDALSGAFTESSKIYKRPDILTATDKEFDEMDFVAVLSEKEGWYEVKGKRPTDKWFVSGYVRSESVSTEDIDVGFSVLYQKAMAKEGEEQTEALNSLLEEGSLRNSVFAPKLKDLLEERKGFDFTVESAYDCQVGVMKMSEFSTNRDWTAHWDQLEKQYTPALYQGMQKGQYTLIARTSDSTVAVKHIIFDKENDGDSYFIEEGEFK